MAPFEYEIETQDGVTRIPTPKTTFFGGVEYEGEINE